MDGQNTKQEVGQKKDQLILQFMAIAVIYYGLFFALDWLTIFSEVQIGNALWFPATGLSLGLLVLFGNRFVPLWVLATIISAAWIHQLPISPFGIVALSLFIVGGYTGQIRILTRVTKINLRLNEVSDVIWFILTTLVTAFIVGLFSIALFTLSNMPGYDWWSFLPNTLAWWLGDLSGILSVTPFLLIVPQRLLGHQQLDTILSPRNILKTSLPFLSILIAIWLAFFYPPLQTIHLYYLSLLPLVWIALQFGLTGASAGVLLTNTGMILAAKSTQIGLGNVTELQIILLVVSLAGLFLGAVVDERMRNEIRYHNLFDESPIPLWLVDCSQLRTFFENKKAEGVTDFREYFKDNPDEFVQTARLLRILDINQATLQLYKAQSKEHLQENLSQIMSPETFDSSLDSLLAIANNEQNFQIQTVNQTLGGEQIDVIMRWSLEPDDAGELTRMLMSIINITSRVQAERALQESQHFNQAISDANPSYMYIYDFQAGENIWVNKAWQDYLGKFTGGEVEVIKENKIISLVHPDDRKLLEKRVQELRDSSELRWNEIEFRLRDMQGNWHWFQDRVSVFQRTPNGEISKIIASLIEITERKQAEYALQESQHFIQATSNTNPSYMYIYDYQIGKNIWMNKAWHDYLSKIAGEDIEGINEQQLFSLFHPDDIALLDQRAQVLLDVPDLEWHEIELRVRGKDGNWHWFLDRGAVFERTKDGRIHKIIASLIEVTDRKLAELALQEYSERLEEMVEARTHELHQAQEQLIRHERLAILGQLGGGIAHELRTPLGAIKNMAYFLNMVLDKPDDEIKEALEVIDKEVNTSAKIINSLLDYARPSPPMHVLVDINYILRRVIERAQVPNNIQVMEQLDEEIESIYADPDKLTQIFLNLITNAIQAMPKGGQLSIKSGEIGSEHIFAVITDTGLGISVENQKKLFQPLFTTKARGIGLGLSLVKMMIEEHEGRIEVESEEGLGSTFTVIFPLKSNEDEING